MGRADHVPRGAGRLVRDVLCGGDDQRRARAPVLKDMLEQKWKWISSLTSQQITHIFSSLLNFASSLSHAHLTHSNCIRPTRLLSRSRCERAYTSTTTTLFYSSLLSAGCPAPTGCLFCTLSPPPGSQCTCRSRPSRSARSPAAAAPSDRTSGSGSSRHRRASCSSSCP